MEIGELPIEEGVDLPDTVADQLRWLADTGLSASIVFAEADLAILEATGTDRRPAREEVAGVSDRRAIGGRSCGRPARAGTGPIRCG